MRTPDRPPLYEVGMTVEVAERRAINACEFDEGIEGEIEGWERATIQDISDENVTLNPHWSYQVVYADDPEWAPWVDEKDIRSPQ